MARTRKPAGPTPVESIGHQETRSNIPTADAQEFYDDASEQVQPVRYPRDPALDPQLVWRGADAQDSEDLVVDAPPIFIQEKIDPRVLVENLRRTAAKPEDEPELSLFDNFDGLDELSQVEFYEHRANWSNRMILGDSLQAMASLAERESLRGKVQMVYIDPPYGIKFNSNWQVSARKRDVKDGKLEHAAREAEQIKAFRDTWADGIHTYLSYLRDRLVAARDLLTESGSCFVQIGDENVHVVRSLMDEVFGAENFVSQIVFRKKLMPLGSKTLERMHDHIVWFARAKDALKYRQMYLPTTPDRNGRWTGVEDASGNRRGLTTEERRDPANLGQGLRIFGTISQWAPSYSETNVFDFDFGGVTYRPSRGQCWVTSPEKMTALAQVDRLFVEGDSPRFISYHDDFPFKKLTNPWFDTAPASGPTYVVQTSLKPIERCILMATDPGDLVLDPTCGSGTTAYVAEQWGRRWITMDTSRVAFALARQRLMGAKYPYYLISDTPEGKAKEAEVSGVPHDPDLPTGGDIRHGFVYERVQHITLKSIANNPDIVEGMSREEIDAAIKRHADFEYLYDKPYEDKKKVRVSGPFTVESLSPYRSVSFDPDVQHEAGESISEATGESDPEGPGFERSIFDNLAQAGIQNGRRSERIEFAALNEHAGEYVQAIADTREADDGTAMSVALALGPQYGTVDARFIKAAAKEALANPDVDMLCVLAFAFDPQATSATTEDGVTVDASDEGFAEVAGERKLGRLPVLLVRMNADLLMGEDLKKTGAGNLFTVFGEPDIVIRDSEGGQLIVDLLGVDVYDPTKGEVRSKDTGQIALWMIDTDYNGESFFVRHCYFTGGNDPYKKLKTSLKADIDADAWASLYRTESRPFARPSTGRIAVKVINDYGDEVTKVFDVQPS
ncbi:site-specific DNA-methyltransferase [Gordonia phthalatica]|uniref:DNA methylase n=1 Tax=Gordonia phthalatica TaxID=1136941 RepID=A0A0N9NG99_9ACTN|nr:site-specific DNA-methyltransferase [Gordonia phthalatica]ALG84365.1 DNA methylase [Gordonia phthalatica]